MNAKLSPLTKGKLEKIHNRLISVSFAVKKLTLSEDVIELKMGGAFTERISVLTTIARKLIEMTGEEQKND